MMRAEDLFALTTEQKSRYEADGFLVLPEYLDAQTVAELSHAAEEIVAHCGPLTPDNPRVQVDRVGESVGIRQVYPIIDLSERMARFAEEERIVGLFRSLFNGDAPVLFEDKLNCKQPHVGSLFPMHQDYSYWQDYSPRLASALIYLDEATEENGCLEVVPGRHKAGLLERSEMNVGAAKDHYILPEVLDPAQAVKVPGKPGTVLLFSCLTPHRSAPNHSDKPRRALILTYNPAADASGYEATSGAARDQARAWLTAQAPASYGTAWADRIYQEGLKGAPPTLPFSIEAMEQKAKEILSPEAYDYVAGGAGSEDTIRENLAAFRRWRIVPRMLCNVAERDLRVEVCGTTLRAPVLLAPIGLQSVVHPDAERMVARAAASVGFPLVLSGFSSTPLEEVGQIVQEVPHWFQLYWPKHPDLTRSLLTRAEQAGYSAIVVTVDNVLLGRRERDLQRAYLASLRGVGRANYFSDPVFRSLLDRPPEEDLDAAIRLFSALYSDPTLTWKDLAFLRRHTRLPILLKGILHPDDAVRAVDCGMDGVIVSNHGGRQIDGSIAALDALPGVVSVVDGAIPVLMDSGIRRGADVVKALALGAKAVLLGRPYIWGLAVGGEEGVRHVLLNLLADLETTLALTGCATCQNVQILLSSNSAG